MSAQRLSREEFLAAYAAKIAAAGLCNDGRNNSNTKKPRTEPCQQCGDVVPENSRYRKFCKDACEVRHRAFSQDGESEAQPIQVTEKLCIDCGLVHRRHGNICSRCERARADKHKELKLSPEIVTCVCGCGRTFEKRRTTHVYFDPLVCGVKMKNKNRRKKYNNERNRNAASGHHGSATQPQDLPGTGEPQGRGVADQPPPCASATRG